MVARPLVVRAELRGPLVDRGDPIHLDGLLSLVWARRHPAYGHATRRRSVAELEQPHLPLARVVALDRWVWAASAAVLTEPVHPAVVHQTGRRDPEDWDRLLDPVNVTAGPSKDWMTRREARLAPSLTWWCIGERREVVRSLRLLWGPERDASGAVGTARRAGAGEIVRWSVEAGGAPADCIAGDGGALRRHVPAAWLVEPERVRHGAACPPYWHPGRGEQVGLVGSVAKVRPEVWHALERLC